MAKYVLNLSDETQLLIIDHGSRFNVTRVVDIGVGKRHIIAIASDGTSDGKVYRFDEYGDNDDALISLYERSAFEWSASESNVPKIVVDTRASDGRLRIALTWPEGDVETLVAAARVAPAVNFPTSLPKRRAVLLGRE
jgi:hypothetical protein